MRNVLLYVSLALSISACSDCTWPNDWQCSQQSHNNSAVREATHDIFYLSSGTDYYAGSGIYGDALPTDKYGSELPDPDQGMIYDKLGDALNGTVDTSTSWGETYQVGGT